MDPTTQPQVTSQQQVAQEAQPTALAQPMVTAALTQSQQVPQVPARAKETGPATSNELAGYVEVVGGDSIEKEPLPPEVASWMEKVSRDTTGEKPPEIVIASPPQSVGDTTSASSQVFVLPLGEEDLEKGKRQSVSNSVRWLSEWCVRLVKKLGEQTTFR